MLSSLSSAALTASGRSSYRPSFHYCKVKATWKLKKGEGGRLGHSRHVLQQLSPPRDRPELLSTVSLTEPLHPIVSESQEHRLEWELRATNIYAYGDQLWLHSSLF